VAAPLQHGHRFAYIRVFLGGRDITDVMSPHLISVRVLDKVTAWDEAHLELDDRDASLAIPPDDTEVKVEMGWSGTGPVLPPEPIPLPEGSAWQLPFWDQSPYVFVGYVDSAESGFARRGGGRRLWVDAKSMMSKSDIKKHMMKGWGKGDEQDSREGGKQKIPLSQVWGDVAKSAGLNGVLSPSMAGKKLDRWDMNESPMHMGARLAKQLGGDFKVVGNQMILFSKDDQMYPTVEAEWGINLISWRIKPFVGRPQYGSAQTNDFGISEGSWFDTVKNIAGSTPFGGAKAVAGLPFAAPNKQSGEMQSDGAGQDSQARRGTGWLIMNGEPMAKAQGRATLTGARPGVDGTYRIVEAEHNFSRRGYTTRCELDRPQLNVSHYMDMGWPKTEIQEGPPVPMTIIPPAGTGGTTPATPEGQQ
jgi:phage protein D